MVSKNQLKLIKSLHQKKYRNQHGLFFVEGKKAVNEFLKAGYEPNILCCTQEFLTLFEPFNASHISESALKGISALKSPNGVLAVFKIPAIEIAHADDWVVALDDVRDPGNLGTIIRLCDWFGIHHLICSPNTVDCYNPKVLQATMGSITRVHVAYQDLEKFIGQTSLPVYGAFMQGTSVYQKQLPESGVLLMGNEANGISKQLEVLLANRLTIPQFGDKNTESLNVATATAILLSEIRRG